MAQDESELLALQLKLAKALYDADRRPVSQTKAIGSDPNDEEEIRRALAEGATIRDYFLTGARELIEVGGSRVALSTSLFLKLKQEALIEATGERGGYGNTQFASYKSLQPVIAHETSTQLQEDSAKRDPETLACTEVKSEQRNDGWLRGMRRKLFGNHKTHG